MDKNQYSIEVRNFLFYARMIWPIHRKLANQFITPRCMRCIASANLRPLNKQGLCADCINPALQQTAKPSNPNITQDLNNALKSYVGQGKGDFDALVLFSGGKDSVYMVNTLLNEYPKLRLLLFTVDNTFMSPIAMNNIHLLTIKLGIDHAIYRPPSALYEKIFRYAFLHLNANGCSGTVDQFDGDLFHDIARNWAAQKKIPLVLSGCSKTQVMRILGLNHFEFSAEFEAQERTHVAGIRLKDFLDDAEMRYWWNGARIDESSRPRVIFPFYAWDLKESEIIQAVTSMGLLSKSASPLLTNSQLVPLMAMVDMVKFGYSSFEPEFTQMIREGKSDAQLWKNIFELSEYAAKTGHLVSQSVDNVLKRLNLSRQELGLPI